MSDIKEKTKCYTYKVTMIVQVLAKDSAIASDKVDNIGGHITSRKVELLSTTDIPGLEDKPDLDKKLKSTF